jgi:transglutaminase-like putative cysteine protease/uncharacterized protein HemY
MQAILCRSAALYIFLYQIHLLTADISDTSVFVATILGAFAAAFVLYLHCYTGQPSVKRGVFRGGIAKARCVPYILVLLLIPCVIRLFIVFPRFLSGDADINNMILFDSLLLNYDRNSFITNIPFYWAALSTFFSLQTRRALRVSIIVDCVFFIAAFSIARSVSIYTLPVLRIIIFTLMAFFELTALILSSPPEMRPQKKDYAVSFAFLFLLAAICGALLVRPLQERALEQGGGLLQPKLFSFDFAPYLMLENEISMNDDLIFIVRKNSHYEADDNSLIDELPSTVDMNGNYNFETDYYDDRTYTDDHYLMRRFVLSAYNTKEEKDKAIGFFRNDEVDEKAQSAQLPRGKKEYSILPGVSRKKLGQEYYLVNIDGSAFIAMNDPVETLPFESWDASSFKSAYAVNSMVSICTPVELIRSVPDGYDAQALGLTEEDYEYYTKFSDSKDNKRTEREKKITALAEEITFDTSNYWEKIQSIYQHLKFGDYRYSLKPGIAPSGDQLAYFLFDTKKGYCSYFAFAFASLLRSINIPCRVAVGFFLEPDEGKLDFYPVRSNMAHAWVEVWFPGFGWIEYDPTTEKLAEGEDFEFSSGIPEELFERLMKEIIDNHGRLKIKEAVDDINDGLRRTVAAQAIAFIKKSFAYIAIIIIVAVFIVVRFGCYIRYFFSRDPRKKTMRLWRHIKLRMMFAGMRKTGAESEWVNNIMAKDKYAPLRALYDNISAAKYAERYTHIEQKEFLTLYKTFNVWYKKRFSLLKRIKKHNAAQMLMLVFCITLLSSNIKAYTQESNGGAEELFVQALAAANNEFWERAIELYVQGKTEYPLDYRFPLRLGALYFDRELYRLAMDEFLIANDLLPDNVQLLYRLAQTAGNLNENKTAAVFLERLLVFDPKNREAIGALGWMYFKLHRLHDGEKLLTSAIERFGADPDFCMTLGTIYSDMFNYIDAKRYYLDAVNGAVNLGDIDFASVAYYNLSILESRFYRYQEAFTNTTSSLLMADRASGHLARGELMMRRLDFSETFSEYNKSYEIDKSQLSKVSLAQAFLSSGDLEQARAYAENCISSNNLYWMLNYGIDPDQYKRDLHEILYKVYRGLGKKEALTAHYGLPDAVHGIALRIAYYFKYKAHKLLYQKYSLLSAGAFETGEGSGGRHLEALLEYYNAFYDYKDRAMYYLRAAEDFEVELIPEAAPSYLLETGRLLQNIMLLNEALPNFDPVWEKDLVADVYTEVALIAKRKGQTDISAEAAGRLFALNKGALRQNGIRLPVRLEITDEDGGGKRRDGALKNVLNNVGFDTKTKIQRWILRLRLRESEVYMELYDSGTGIVNQHKTLPLKSFTQKDIVEFANTLANEVF